MNIFKELRYFWFSILSNVETLLCWRRGPGLQRWRCGWNTNPSAKCEQDFNELKWLMINATSKLASLLFNFKWGFSVQLTVVGLSWQNRPLSGQPEWQHPAGDDQGGAEDAVSRGGGARLLPVTDDPVYHCCKWELSTVSDVSFRPYLTGLTGFFYCAGCQLKGNRRNRSGPNGTQQPYDAHFRRF